jgi:cysteine sulfinate desulfinase/cysteine desulfurase-like protein
VLPVKQLVALLHTYNIPVIVDGAHAVGNVNINIDDMSNVDCEGILAFRLLKPLSEVSTSADYFTNLHKWYLSPKSVG